MSKTPLTDAEVARILASPMNHASRLAAMVAFAERLERKIGRMQRMWSFGDRLELLLRCETGIEDTEEWACATREMQLGLIAKAQRDWRKAKELET